MYKFILKEIDMVVIKKSLRILAGLILVSVIPFAQAESKAVLEEELSQLHSDFAGNVAQVKSGIDKLEWTGISDVALFDNIAERIQANYKDNSEVTLELNSWLVKALALSGQAKYQPLLDEILSGSTHPKLKKHTATAAKRLPEFQRWNPIISAQTQTVSSVDQLNRMRILNMLNSSDAELTSAGTRKIYHSYTRDLAMVNKVNDLLLARYKTSASEEQLDALAWMCRTLGESGFKEFKPTLETISKDPSTPKKLVKYAAKYQAIL
jgi:hypothetical protein